MDAFLHLFASQVVSRALTFGLNVLSARSLTPQAYGVVAIQLHLLNTTLLFLSREGFRRGCLRIDPGRPLAVLGTSALCIPLGSAMAALAVTMLSWRHPDDPTWHAALLLQGVAVVVELVGEPMFILATVQQRYSLRVVAEAGAQLGKSVTALALLARPGTDAAVAFSWAQLTYAGLLTGAYVVAWIAGARKNRHVPNAAAAKDGDDSHNAPKTLLGSQRLARLEVDGHALQLSGLFGAQALGKLGLAEGSKFVLAGGATAYDQGVMGLVTNLGSLVVRTVFQPYEEAAFYAFSAAAAAKTCGEDKRPVAVTEPAAAAACPQPAEEDSGAGPRRTPRRRAAASSHGRDADRGAPGPTSSPPASARGHSKASRIAAASAPPPAAALLPPLTRCILTLALFAAAFAPGYAWPLLRLAYGATWASTPAPAVLGLYAATLPLLATNGVLEACLHGTAGHAALARGNAVLWGLSAAHLAALVAATAVAGPPGMLAADAGTMALRIVYCAAYARRELGVHPVSLVPRAGTAAALAVAAVFTSLSRATLLPESAAVWRMLPPPPALGTALAWLAARPLWPRLGLHVAAGGLALAAATLTALRCERDALGALRRLRRGRDAA